MCIALAAAAALTAAGCGSLYANCREIEQLLVIQTMGLDTENGTVRLSLASAADKDGNVSRLSASGDSVSTALERIYNYSYEEQLFCSHIGEVLIGETAAEQGIDDTLDFICRSPLMRLDMPLYIVRGMSAEDAVMGIGSGDRGAADILDSVELFAQRHFGGGVYTAADVLRDLDRCGSALICAIDCGEASEKLTEDDGSEGAMTAAVSGYAVIRGGKLCRFLDSDQALAVGLLRGGAGIRDIRLSDGRGSAAVIELNGGSGGVSPVWAAPGVLRGLRIHAEVQGSVIETDGHTPLTDDKYCDALTARLEAYISHCISETVSASKELNADFLCLAPQIELQSPANYRMMTAEFPDVLPELECEISVSARLLHTNDMRDAQK